MRTEPYQTWLITGASSGLGKAIAAAALTVNHRVIGTTRDVEKAESSYPEFASDGGIWVCLDPAQHDAYERFSEVAVDYNVDVLVNSAGYAFIGAVEDTSEEEIRAQMEVNFYGPLRAARACLPIMREKGSGHIILISSGAGIIARPARSTYAASKFGIEAIHESLSQEVKPFGIKVLIVEPGAFRTPFPGRQVFPSGDGLEKGYSNVYKDTPVEEMMALSKDMDAATKWIKGDPEKAARALVVAVDNGYAGYGFLRMPLGRDCVRVLEEKIAALQADLEATREVAMGTDVDVDEE
ncbi:short-chain dehydrogenase/reductase SDR [Aspergillus eucalypticola CBS 122712]|uniref:Short-chain dehydrogenase/reductase SDR n=1 Tax=Aspergillus eucalypticola (strain CBS 122712 / IBT 29274) TaxID=1448314 RepID=A0A317W5I7_ASPEC|nr:short-chain dehydrogenase/reductase SDR [Aspergillus eucalypticola CBS 122712]PWY81325.1 short-chain dehydrogenase/reductase SDR [Aspergillus eucalypticola CBS 122712]